MHVTSLGRDNIDQYLSVWNSAGDSVLSLMPHLEHFVLACGLLLRDISTAYFTLDDPDDTEPLYIPEYISQTQCDLQYGVHIESVIDAAYQALRRQQEEAGSAAEKRSAAIIDDLIDPQLRMEEEESLGVDQVPVSQISLQANGLQLTDKTRTTPSKAPSALQSSGSPHGTSNQPVQPNNQLKKRRKPVPSKPRPDAFSRTFDSPPPKISDPPPTKGSKRLRSPEREPERDPSPARPRPQPRKKRRQQPDVPAADLDESISGLESGPAPADELHPASTLKRQRSPTNESGEHHNGGKEGEQVMKKRKTTGKAKPPSKTVATDLPLRNSSVTPQQGMAVEQTAPRQSGRLQTKERLTYKNLIRRG